jgi:ribonucleotide monophosphatase NagD (HAD superfamily)
MVLEVRPAVDWHKGRAIEWLTPRLGGGLPVFVGDDPVTDIAGAHAVGMKTIWLPSRLDAASPAAAIADVLVASLADVPAAAARLILPDWRAHVA